MNYCGGRIWKMCPIGQKGCRYQQKCENMMKINSSNLVGSTCKTKDWYNKLNPSTTQSIVIKDLDDN
jgi:hypothetical protein